MTEFKGTKGRATVGQPVGDLVLNASGIYDHLGYRIAEVMGIALHRTLAEVQDDSRWAEGLANAHLIAEAFTVRHETGFSPRELAEQNKELIAILKRAVDQIEWSYGFLVGDPGRVELVSEAKAIFARNETE
jgi:hypothetical protein